MNFSEPLKAGRLTLAELRALAAESMPLVLDSSCRAQVEASTDAVQSMVATEQIVYGINTGFGRLANRTIATEQLGRLQRNLVLSHAAGIGPLLDDRVVRLILILKINSLCRGFSGVRWVVIEALQRLLDKHVYPCIPAKGSVGASGDLAPLAHLAATLLGVGEARHQGRRVPAEEALAIAGLKPLELAAKEGLALLNGTQVSTALALEALFATGDLFAAAVLAGMLSVDAAKGSDAPFDERIHWVRGQEGQIRVAALYRDLLAGSEIRDSHQDCGRVQDPYSLRCQPQVMGACLDHLAFAASVLEREANAVSDNPLVFASEGVALSGGNFHAEPVAMASDQLALVIAEIGALSERRLALLIDASLSELPAFLVSESGVNSGFMVAQVTAAALASENKSLAHPASVDSLPTSANQEDHVSMATYAARRLGEMVDNSAGIVAIELLAATQGIEFHAPLKTSKVLGAVVSEIRSRVPAYLEDRFFSPDIEAIRELVRSGTLSTYLPFDPLSSR